MVSQRIMQSTTARSAMTLTADPASLTMWCTLMPSRNCCLSRPMAVWATTVASAALSAFQGRDACPPRPVYITCQDREARNCGMTTSLSDGWTIMAAWVPSNTPRLTMISLPVPFSSAGVPKTRTVSPSSSAWGASARAAPIAAAAIVLWPQPCPMPGSASISAQRPITRSPDPVEATNAVGRSATPFSTENRPPSPRTAMSAADVSCSSKASSGLALIRCDSSRTESRFCSNTRSMRSLMPVIGTSPFR